MEYLGSARNVRELIKLLEQTDSSSCLELQSLDDSWSYVEVWYNRDTDTVILK
jgi:hypothetical protein